MQELWQAIDSGAYDWLLLLIWCAVMFGCVWPAIIGVIRRRL